MMTATSTMSVLPTGEPKIDRSMSPICRARPKWAASPSDEVPEISVERSFTVLSTLPRFDRAGYHPLPPSVRGADDLRRSTQHGHGILIETGAGVAIDHDGAKRGTQRRTQNDLGRDAAADLKAQRRRIDPAQRITQGAVRSRHLV